MAGASGDQPVGAWGAQIWGHQHFRWPGVHLGACGGIGDDWMCNPGEWPRLRDGEGQGVPGGDRGGEGAGEVMAWSEGEESRGRAGVCQQRQSQQGEAGK